MTFQRIGRAIEKTWAAYPLIGIIALFAVLGFSIYQGYKAKEYAKTTVKISAANSDLIKKNLKTKDDVIAEKDRQIAEKDLNIQSLTTVVGQVYNAAIALQQQVTMLGGKPKVIPVTIPSRTSFVPPSKPAGSSVPTTITTTATVTSECKLGLSAAPLNIVQLQVCIPPSKGS